MEYDEKTGTFKGLPDVWAHVVPKEMSQDETSTRCIAFIKSDFLDRMVNVSFYRKSNKCHWTSCRPAEAPQVI